MSQIGDQEKRGKKSGKKADSVEQEEGSGAIETSQFDIAESRVKNIGDDQRGQKGRKSVGEKIPCTDNPCEGEDQCKKNPGSFGFTGHSYSFIIKSPWRQWVERIFSAAAIGIASRIPQKPMISPKAMTTTIVTRGLRSIDSLNTRGLTR